VDTVTDVQYITAHPGAPVPLTEVELKKLEQYLWNQLEEGYEEHLELEARLREWNRAYDGDPRERRRTFPWPGAANIEIPVIGIAVDSIAARLLNTIYSVEPFWTVRPLRKEVDKIAKPTEHYLDWSRKVEYNLYKQTKTWCIEVIKHGWGWLKFGWEVYSVHDWVVGSNGEPEPRTYVVRRPSVYHVLNMDMITQPGVEDDLVSEWLCHRVRLTDNQLLMRKIDNLYEYVDEMIKTKEDNTRVHEMLASSKTAGYTREERLNTLYEFNVDWPFGPEGAPTAMLVTFHREIKKIVRVIFNPYGFRNYEKAKFIEREGRLEGFGVAKRLAQLQEGISTIHRQQVDNATVANTRFFLGRKGVVRPGTQIWPARFLTVNDPERDIKALQLGDIYPSMRALEVSELSYAERASGVSDYQLGRESQVAGSRATATGTLALIQEGNRRFDLNVRDLRDVLSQVGRRVLEINQRFRPRGAVYFVEGEDGVWVEQVLSLPAEFSASKLAVELTASTATINREVEKQSLIGLLGVVTNYYQQLMQLGMLVVNPQAPPELKALGVKMAQGAKLLMDRIVQSFDVKSIDTVVPTLAAEAVNEQLTGAFGGGGAGGQGGAGSPPGGGVDPRMAAILGAAGNGAAAGAGGA